MPTTAQLQTRISELEHIQQNLDKLIAKRQKAIGTVTGSAITLMSFATMITAIVFMFKHFNRLPDDSSDSAYDEIDQEREKWAMVFWATLAFTIINCCATCKGASYRPLTSLASSLKLNGLSQEQLNKLNEAIAILQKDHLLDNTKYTTTAAESRGNISVAAMSQILGIVITDYKSALTALESDDTTLANKYANFDGLPAFVADLEAGESTSLLSEAERRRMSINNNAQRQGGPVIDPVSASVCLDLGGCSF